MSMQEPVTESFLRNRLKMLEIRMTTKIMVVAFIQAFYIILMVEILKK